MARLLPLVLQDSFQQVLFNPLLIERVFQIDEDTVRIELPSGPVDIAGRFEAVVKQINAALNIS